MIRVAGTKMILVDRVPEPRPATLWVSVDRPGLIGLANDQWRAPVYVTLADMEHAMDEVRRQQ